MRIGVKYCGGCNPRHDRGAYVKAEEKKRGISMERAAAGIHYDEIYVICGCDALCADITGLEADLFHYVDHLGEKTQAETVKILSHWK